MKSKESIALAALLLLAACGKTPADPPAAKADLNDAASSLAPAIIAPEESTVPSGPPSYEVSIATAAADHNKAVNRCNSQPEAIRTQCQQEANAAFLEAQEQLQDLRGNAQ